MSALCYIYIVINYRTRLSDFIVFLTVQRRKEGKEIKYGFQYHKEGEQLENYTKYKLKSSDELASVLNGRDNLFVIACNKCFKEFETVDEPDCDEFPEICCRAGKNCHRQCKI